MGVAMRVGLFLLLGGVAWSCHLAAEVLVRGPGFDLSAEDVQAELDYMPAGLEQRARSDPERLRHLIDDLYRREAIIHAAEEADVASDPKASARLERARKEELVRIMLESQRAQAEARVPDLTARAREIYKAEPKTGAIPERIRVRHILLGADPGEGRQGRRAEAEALLARLHGGEDFAVLAGQRSEDPGSAERGGDLGFFSRGKMVKAFEEAAFALKAPGDLSEVIETRFGFHILKLEEREPARRRSFEEVKGVMMDNLAREWAQQEVEAWRRDLQSPDKAEVDKAALDAFVNRIVQDAAAEQDTMMK
jgi:peptidyl-prolyl cis-trans isomerase C